MRPTKKKSAHGKKNNKIAAGSIRIISGNWRGRKLAVLNSEGLRPTTDRVKETLFNWLMNDIANARCLDLFAGSGSLGFESLSRYAKEVVFVEQDTNAASQLQQNLELLKCTEGKVVNTDALQFLPRQSEGFDLVFIDPPFRKGLAHKACSLLIQHNLIKTNGLVYIETEKGCAELSIPDNWLLLKNKIFGQVHSRLYQVV